MSSQPDPRAFALPLPPGVVVDRSGGLRAAVTDHAVRRYAERVLGIYVPETVGDHDAVDALEGRIDVAAARLHLAYAGGVQLRYGARAVLLGNRARVVVKDSTVVTVKPKRGTP